LSPEITAKLPTLKAKTIKAMRFVQAGLTPREALQIVNDKEYICENAVDKFKAKIKKYSLAEPSVVRLAQGQIKRILRAKAREVVKEKIVEVVDGIEQVKEITQYIHPTDSNILAAAQMVYDRYEPVKSGDSDAGQGNTYIDLSGYTNQTINVMPEQAIEQTAQPIDITQDEEEDK
jgi:uncharacterized protein YlzI (FlbEa/FlbD family)